MNNSADELAIKSLVSRYADGVNRYDRATWGSTWAPQGTWLLREGESKKGREAIVAFWDSIMATLKFAIMIPSSSEIAIDDERATGRWYMVEIVEELGGRGAHIIGVYNDHYTKIDGQWYFSSRQYHMLYETPTSIEGVHRPIPSDQLVAL